MSKRSFIGLCALLLPVIAGAQTAPPDDTAQQLQAALARHVQCQMDAAQTYAVQMREVEKRFQTLAREREALARELEALKAAKEAKDAPAAQ